MACYKVPSYYLYICLFITIYSLWDTLGDGVSAWLILVVADGFKKNTYWFSRSVLSRNIVPGTRLF